MAPLPETTWETSMFFYEVGGGIPCPKHGGRDCGPGAWWSKRSSATLDLWDFHSDHSDQSRVMAEVARVLGLEKMCMTPYHPHADGQVERFNRMHGAMLTAVAPRTRKTGIIIYLS